MTVCKIMEPCLGETTPAHPAPDTSPWGSVSSALVKLSPCAYRFRMGMVNPGLELVPGRKGRLPSACLVLPRICSGHFPPGPGPSRPLPRLKLAKPLVPGRGIQPLSALPRSPFVQRPRAPSVLSPFCSRGTTAQASLGSRGSQDPRQQGGLARGGWAVPTGITTPSPHRGGRSTWRCSDCTGCGPSKP